MSATLAYRGWMIAISLFEVPEIYGFLVKKNKFVGFSSNLHPGDPERKILVTCRHVLTNDSCCQDGYGASC
jgi:hypothetical protein